MADAWQLLTDDPAERAWFADLRATLALPSTPAGPQNRLRHVVQIRVGGRTYYLKSFAGTQWKNRVRFRCTAPRAADDAERELRITEALRAAGFGAPRPVARGRRGKASFYLCAELPGQSLAALVAAGAAPPDLARRSARHCGGLLAAGFHLPDLTLDHVFVAAGAPLSVLDLHNGTLAAPGPAPRRVCARVLRRFLRAARPLPVLKDTALRFAVRLLRAAGRGNDVRAMLRRLPPFATAARYETSGKSARYADRNPARSGRELALLARVWPGHPGETVLDAPCGTGRLLPLLRDRLGHRVVAADGALAMLRQAGARAAAPAPAVQADALALPFADGATDGVVVFRFLHHLPPPLAAIAIAEACRVARRFVVLSFFHPCSLHHLRRRLAQIGGGAPTRFVRTLGETRAALARHGFVLHAHAADFAFARDLWVASFVRRGTR